MHEQTPAQRIILGIDPGTLRLGWGLVRVHGRQIGHLGHGVVRPPARSQRPERLGALLVALQELMATHAPDVLACETVFVRLDPRAALALGEARGIALALAASRQMQIHEVSPSETKRAVVGAGRASKAQMQEMVRLQLDLAVAPPEDAADALAAALTVARQLALGVVGAAPNKARRHDSPRPAAAPLTEAQAYYASVLAAARAAKGGRR